MNINGDWFNELGSKMTLTVNGSTLTGEYHTAVGDADGVYRLVGRVSVPNDQNRTLGFVVTWQNDRRSTDSATSWAGEVREIDGEQMIITTWLLTLETAPQNDWKSTLVGKDIFTRLQPSAESAKLMKSLKNPSHHLNA